MDDHRIDGEIIIIIIYVIIIYIIIIYHFIIFQFENDFNIQFPERPDSFTFTSLLPLLPSVPGFQRPSLFNSQNRPNIPAVSLNSNN